MLNIHGGLDAANPVMQGAGVLPSPMLLRAEEQSFKYLGSEHWK